MEKLIFYHGNGCPHCEAAIPNLEKVEKELGIKLTKKEIWGNEENKEEFKQNCPEKLIPAFYNPTNKEVAYRLESYEEISEWIKNQK